LFDLGQRKTLRHLLQINGPGYQHRSGDEEDEWQPSPRRLRHCRKPSGWKWRRSLPCKRRRRTVSRRQCLSYPVDTSTKHLRPLTRPSATPSRRPGYLPSPRRVEQPRSYCREISPSALPLGMAC
jgi:hypothetical protein